MQKKEQVDVYFNLYHGKRSTSTSDPLKIPFVQQAIEALSVFGCLYDMKDAPVLGRLTESPIRPVRFRINPLLLPGTTDPIYVGAGPTADIRLEHLEMTALGGKNNTFVAGRTLMRMADSVKLLLRKVEPLAMECMNKDGTRPSGEDVGDFLARLIDKIIEQKSKGQFKEEDSPDGDDDVRQTSHATLTQGEAVMAEAARKSKQADWTQTYIPVTGWFSIALFCKHGIARTEAMENKLPLLKSGDYGKVEKGKHSRRAVRGDQQAEKSRARASGVPGDASATNLSIGGYSTQDHLLASVVSLMADTNDNAAKTDIICNKRDHLRLLMNELKHIEWRIDRYIQTGRDVDKLFDDYDDMMKHCRDLRTELDGLMTVEEKKRAADETTDTARKVARLVQSCPPAGMIPSQIEKDNATKISALHTETDDTKTDETNEKQTLSDRTEEDTPSKQFFGVGNVSFDSPLATQVNGADAL